MDVTLCTLVTVLASVPGSRMQALATVCISGKPKRNVDPIYQDSARDQ